ncbi:Uridine phosphorylase [Fasciolopsis buskii]|uniref:Uridine phosphorylase n=1 Tax=Fasciolopsis buskii TaxID=27845 RepID=A0A8E0VRX9_9TREM|nr:Uridine phosphorylase [Fasciolopsis buski]
MNIISERRFDSKNPNLTELGEDHLYHLGLSTGSTDFKSVFGDVKFVCTAGSASRIRKLAQHLAEQSGANTDLRNLAEKGGRFVLFKVGPVLCADHGMGTPSLSILLHELFKLIHYAGCKDVTFFRLGTSGGIGVKPGTIVVTSESLNTELKPIYELRILGKLVSRPTAADPELANELVRVANESNICNAILGKTVCANDFYEEQARLDGAFCSITEEDKFAYLKLAHEKGVRNFEMECTCFTALCRLAGVRAAVVCVTLVNRLISDQVRVSPEDYANFQELPGKVIIEFLKKHNSL